MTQLGNCELTTLFNMETGTLDIVRSLRFAAYKLFTYLIHGYLGKGVRKVVPACAATRIRREFPELSAVYIGFKHGDDGEIIEVPEQFAI